MRNHQTSKEVRQRRFDPVPESVTSARHFVLAAQPVDDDLRPRLATATSELVTNAVVHAQTPFVVKVIPGEGRLRVTVVDESPSPPKATDPPGESKRGRGLRIVAALVDRWGYEVEDGGKAVWFEIDFSPTPG
ncbi:MAG TPA: ATP-binding protein [Acidimicrobiia bacterium]|nr:ATP-binding protein [Acidimicrobiia bacterium]